MSKKLFLFPGQGSQEIGMARDLFRDDEHFCSLVDQASAITGEDLRTLCLKGPEKKLMQARYLQPLIVAVSLGYLRHIQEKGVKADFVLGHSLGEITALAAAGVIDNKLAIAISAKRGELMDAAASLCSGGMMAVLSMESIQVSALINKLGLQNKIFIANENTPNQNVVSGDIFALDDLSASIAQAGGSSKKLHVSGPWHSPYLRGAYERFNAWVEPIQFSKPHVPIIFNATAKPESDPLKIKKLISLQLCQSVYFKQCMEYCKNQKIDKILEIGPGRVLAGLARANGFMQGVDVYSVNNLRGVALAVA
ncbi:MAG: ACP S-malonyltransferase [Candidatus Omnitrophica bacterium]|nr:ACP S-malonyltransferase [Candidatus Omnitrophota bacterium]